MRYQSRFNATFLFELCKQLSVRSISPPIIQSEIGVLQRHFPKMADPMESSMEMIKWNHAQERILIDPKKEKRHQWDIKHNLYSNRNLKRNSYQIVAQSKENIAVVTVKPGILLQNTLQSLFSGNVLFCMYNNVQIPHLLTYKNRRVFKRRQNIFRNIIITLNIANFGLDFSKVSFMLKLLY